MPKSISQFPDLTKTADLLSPPVVVVLGSPRQVADIAAVAPGEVVCYQMDLHQAQRLREELAELGAQAEVATAPDLWDLPTKFASVVYPAQRGGERHLKLDMVEQAFHVLKPRGRLVVLTDYPNDQFFPGQLKKVFGRVHAPAVGRAQVLWCQRQDDGQRRRHEVVFQAKIGDGPSLRFVSRPGVFSYGRFDDGARALVETVLEAEEGPAGAQVLDLGCGCGTNGTFVGKITEARRVTFVDSNVRAVALTEQNAEANGLGDFRTVASHTLMELPRSAFDVVLANPPYYAQNTIADMFIERSRMLLKPGGRFYMVTKQPDALGPLVADTIGQADVVERRGYQVLCAMKPAHA